MSKVVKFGGSSLASAEQFQKVGNIIRSDKQRRYVVPSAPGKRFKTDTKVTDMLYGCYDLAEADKDFGKELTEIKQRYQEIIDGLKLDLSLEKEFAAIEENFKAKAGSNYAASRGEYLNGIIMAKYLGYEFIDAAEVIFFDGDGNYDGARTNAVLSERLASCERAVIPGFYGSLPDGTVKTFSRGGSDVTGSIVAKAARVDVYENWTDGFCAVNIEKDMMNSEIGFGRKVLQVFEENGISFEHVPSGIDTMTVFVHQDEFMHKEQQVAAGIHRLARPDDIEIESDLALIAVVGRGMKSTRGTAGRIFAALAHSNVNVRMIDQGSSELNIIIGVSNEDFETAIRAIYDIFVVTRL